MVKPQKLQRKIKVEDMRLKHEDNQQDGEVEVSGRCHRGIMAIEKNQNQDLKSVSFISMKFAIVLHSKL